jgi:hypothetical protein
MTDALDGSQVRAMPLGLTSSISAFQCLRKMFRCDPVAFFLMPVRSANRTDSSRGELARQLGLRLFHASKTSFSRASVR